MNLKPILPVQFMCFFGCKLIPQQALIGFVAESAKMHLYFDDVCCFGFDKQIAKNLTEPLKILPKIYECAETATVVEFLRNLAFCRFHKQK